MKVIKAMQSTLIGLIVAGAALSSVVNYQQSQRITALEDNQAAVVELLGSIIEQESIELLSK
jgi:hypothetical protein